MKNEEEREGDRERLWSIHCGVEVLNQVPINNTYHREKERGREEEGRGMKGRIGGRKEGRGGGERERQRRERGLDKRVECLQ
jgi:hypothetical protein